jgi:uncharacterized membrane protein
VRLCEMISGSSKKVAIVQFLSVVSLSMASGIFFVLALQNWMRSDSTSWMDFAVAAALLLIVVLYCRRALKMVP